MFYLDRANVVSTLVVLGLILDAFLQLPTWTRDLSILGSPLTISISQTVLIAALLVGITCTGTDVIVRSHPAEGRRARNTCHSCCSRTAPAASPTNPSS